MLVSLGGYLNESLAVLLADDMFAGAGGYSGAGRGYTQQMEADQVETEEVVVVVVPPAGKEAPGVGEDARGVEAQVQRLLLMMAVLGPESSGYVCYVDVLHLNFQRNPKPHVTVTLCPDFKEECE